MIRKAVGISVFGIAIISLFASPSRADWFTGDGNVNGYLTNWDISVGKQVSEQNSYGFIPGGYDSSLYPVGTNTNPMSGTAAGLAGTGLFFYHLEDTKDTATSGGYVGPHYGGQNYDGEFLGAAFRDDKLYIAVVSGIRPDNGPTEFGPGDIRISVNSGEYYLGVEVGGGLGHTGGTQVGPITGGDAGTTYVLNSSGHTIPGSTIVSASSQVAGSVWKGTNANWIADPISDGSTNYVQINNANPGTNVGAAMSYLYTADSWGIGANGLNGTHSVIEIVLDLTALGLTSADLISQIMFSPACSNDLLIVAPNYSPNVLITPVPSSLVMAFSCLGTIALMGVRKRRKQNS